MTERTGPRAAARRPPVSSRPPSLRVERSLLGPEVGLLAGMDEVGRGALAGPVTVGVVLVDATTRTAPTGVRDSKLLAPDQRQRLAPRIRRWAIGWGVGHASAVEIDTLGIMCALRLAGRRALAALPAQPDLVLLDGSYDWLTRTPPTLFDPPCGDLPVRIRIKADLHCASVAAASILAKTTRDAMMVEHAAQHPAYAWDCNKGYASPTHRAALARHGPSELHRCTWNGVRPDDGLEPDEGLDPDEDAVDDTALAG